MINEKDGIFDIPMELSAVEECSRTSFEKMLLGAQERISMFAYTHQWGEHVSTPLIERVRVCGTKEQFDGEFKNAFNLDSELNIPDTVSAVIAEGVLQAVTPETYAANYKVGQEEHAYEKLLAHELAHELHIRILEGNEDQMGPRWFFEGFALYAANQFDHTTLELTKEDIEMIISSDQSVSYVYYRLLMDELLLHVNLKEAVDHAKYPNFEDFVRKVFRV